jgi:hypothetical protein
MPLRGHIRDSQPIEVTWDVFHATGAISIVTRLIRMLPRDRFPSLPTYAPATGAAGVAEFARAGETCPRPLPAKTTPEKNSGF